MKSGDLVKFKSIPEAWKDYGFKIGDVVTVRDATDDTIHFAGNWHYNKEDEHCLEIVELDPDIKEKFKILKSGVKTLENKSN